MFCGQKITFQNPTGGRDRWNNSLTHSSALRMSDSSFTEGTAPDAADDIKSLLYNSHCNACFINSPF